MTLNLHLVGTVHCDRKGPERLARILEYLKPDHVAIESDYERVQKFKEFREMVARGLLDKIIEKMAEYFPDLNRETARAFFAISDFEYFTSNEYCKRKNIPLHLTDSVNVKEIKRELLTRGTKGNDIYTELLSMSLQKLDERTEEYYSEEFRSFSPYEIEQLSLRDHPAGIKLRNLSGKVVYVGGMFHIFGDYHNMFDRLADLNPKRMKLIEADKV